LSAESRTVNVKGLQVPTDAVSLAGEPVTSAGGPTHVLFTTSVLSGSTRVPAVAASSRPSFASDSFVVLLLSMSIHAR
jgi:hypothetical protein